MSKYKDSLADVVAGDAVVYVIPGYDGTMKEAHESAVSRVTKKMVIVRHPRDGEEVYFSREGGWRIGVRAMYRDCIFVGENAEWALNKGMRRFDA